MNTEVTKHTNVIKNEPPRTNFQQIVEDMNAGVFVEQINRALSDVAANVATYGKKGEVVLKFRFKRIGNSNQVVIDHGIKSVIPLERGKITEEHESETPMHVAKGGKLSLYPHEQGDLLGGR
jgi:hypothetical protein